jgi:hypothetical protein
VRPFYLNQVIFRPAGRPAGDEKPWQVDRDPPGMTVESKKHAFVAGPVPGSRGSKTKRQDKKIAESGEKGYGRFMNSETGPPIDPKLLENPVFQRVMADALAIQHRFAAAPNYAKTGKGYLKSEGVEELQRLKEREQAKGN